VTVYQICLFSTSEGNDEPDASTGGLLFRFSLWYIKTVQYAFPEHKPAASAFSAACREGFP
jgi:hypothetical protein